ncbi:MAG: hypothetical protein WCO55_06255 [Candidatus Falkowbacteria bacterium]
MTIFVIIVIMALIGIGKYIVKIANYEANITKLAELFIQALSDGQQIISMVIAQDGRRPRFKVNFWVRGRHGARFHHPDEYVEMILSAYEVLIFNEIFIKYGKQAASSEAYSYWLETVNGKRYAKAMGKVSRIRLSFAQKGMAVRVADLESKIKAATGITAKVD